MLFIHSIYLTGFRSMKTSYKKTRTCLHMLYPFGYVSIYYDSLHVPIFYISKVQSNRGFLLSYILVTSTHNDRLSIQLALNSYFLSRWRKSLENSTEYLVITASLHELTLMSCHFPLYRLKENVANYFCLTNIERKTFVEGHH